VERPRPYGRAEVVAAILDAARDLIAKRGPSRVSLREIADAANVNNGLVFQYVGTKDQLVAEVFRRSSHSVETALAQARSLDAAIDVLVRDPADADIRLLVWAALEAKDPERLFGTSSGLTALAPIVREHASRSGRDSSDADVRVAIAIASMVATAFRVMGPVARIAGGLSGDEAGRFDDVVVRLIRSIIELDHVEVAPADGTA
jgi:AcrR family transcriptional regulator